MILFEICAHCAGAVKFAFAIVSLSENWIMLNSRGTTEEYAKCT